MHRRKIIAANWKMNKSISAAETFAREFSRRSDLADACDIVIIPPFFSVRPVADTLAGTQIHVGAQDLHWEASGAFTGEVSAAMLQDAGATYVIVGHSERRHLMGESDAVVAKKLAAALRASLIPILCVGETLAEREAGRQTGVVERQLTTAFEAVDERAAAPTVIAYEPVWAIGTGRTASAEDAVAMHRAIRDWMQTRFGETAAAVARIQYGGSVNPDNAAELLAREDIDGLLVGGASLDAGSFAAIAGAVPAA